MMGARGTRFDATVAPRRERPPMVMATIDTLSQPFQILGLVHASSAVPADVFPTAHLLDMLEDQAASMGADGVIGIQISQVIAPGASRARLLGRVTDHFGSTAVATAIGTAVRLLSSTDARPAPAWQRGRPR